MANTAGYTPATGAEIKSAKAIAFIVIKTVGATAFPILDAIELFSPACDTSCNTN